MLFWGIGSSIFMIIGALVLVVATPSFSIKDKAFSAIVRAPNRFIPFTLLCLITLLARGVFLYSLVVRFNLTTAWWLIAIVFVAWLLLLASILIPVTINRLLHKYLALIALYLSLIFLVGFQFFILPTDLTGKFLVGLLLTIPFILSKTYKNWGPPEASIAILITLWDWHLLFLNEYYGHSP
ncbi:hypothetical protein CO112_02915 [Candidatus Dojkabacteria bacterium CG_4_9_14_3_um_filter_150_Dojkabacteria_WS6_41_13]|uniref:Uncharacterized protein n=1 Tax=Candidatus Dojkabacteria bacterium CG_4_10_14_0_2_um_filter_Dojkabacteria_WS6_41_15 TaxID=2014249 RepID=A0A2M7W112_9BACT|nr:MAG: hypothetical protein COZ14_00415 [Candidatus Dojkabacteria bacterium CG_4_10_14_3_um_filter_Dojkabacteria_WS6_41_9]PJA12352.1 MAG: hypothetical protein COX64_04615 [Candidatus Dojkabacteria bacterium CG_4_10_14_0_2_um_filter_Dojkabacteria_WS6_41_15]PJB22702.1 MAG: hypothetical protein CO112_02915 [Candidatus Dojkabacteria bacterium CG_4_9_14_3_um_filter_150_Dojkabacteria_WS6_41_13]